MKRFGYQGDMVIAGTAREIKSLYKNLCERTSYIPVFADAPLFNMDRVYGIIVYDTELFEGTTTVFCLVGETVLTQMLLEMVLQ